MKKKKHNKIIKDKIENNIGKRRKKHIGNENFEIEVTVNKPHE